MESVKYQEVFKKILPMKHKRVETFIAEMGQENTRKNYPDGLFQEDG
jgi:hypothetical protein